MAQHASPLSVVLQALEFLPSLFSVCALFYEASYLAFVDRGSIFGLVV